MSREDERDETHRKTVAFVADRADHSEDEDMHPSRLDPAAADLELSLANDARKRRNVERDARDA